MLGLPNSHRDVVLGKFIGRSAVIFVSILVSYVGVALIALLTYDRSSLVIRALHPTHDLLWHSLYRDSG